MADSAETAPAPATTEQGPGQITPAIAPSLAAAGPPPAAGPSTQTGLDQYDLGNTGIELSEAEVQQFKDFGKTRTTPPRDPTTGQFVKPAEAAPPQLVPAPVANKHSQWLTKQAEDLGFTATEIAEAAPEQLQREVYLIQRRLRQEQASQAHADAIENRGRPAETPTGAGSSPPAAPAKEVEWDQQEYETEDPSNPGQKVKYKLAESLVPGLRDVLNELVTKSRAHDQLLANLQQAEHGRQQQAVFSEVDRFFASHADRFGDKPGSEMAKDDPQMKARVAFLRSVGQVQPGKLTSACKETYAALFGAEPPKSPSPAPVPASTPPASTNGHASRITPETWAASGLSRPTHRTGAAEPKGMETAVKKLEEAIAQAEVDEPQAEDNDFRP